MFAPRTTTLRRSFSLAIRNRAVVGFSLLPSVQRDSHDEHHVHQSEKTITIRPGQKSTQIFKTPRPFESRQHKQKSSRILTKSEADYILATQPGVFDCFKGARGRVKNLRAFLARVCRKIVLKDSREYRTKHVVSADENMLSLVSGRCQRHNASSLYIRRQQPEKTTCLRYALGPLLTRHFFRSVGLTLDHCDDSATVVSLRVPDQTIYVL